MKDYVLVKRGQEEEFIVMAKSLGYGELVLVYVPSEIKLLTIDLLESYQDEGFRVYFGVLVENSLAVPVFVEEKIGLGTKLSSLFNGLTKIYYNEFLELKDGLHERRAGLNHVTMAECKQKDVGLLFGFSDLYKEKHVEVRLGRAIQNKKLCVKKKISWELCSMARMPKDMKNAKDVEALRELW
jgi:hypothetical protein